MRAPNALGSPLGASSSSPSPASSALLFLLLFPSMVSLVKTVKKTTPMLAKVVRRRARLMPSQSSLVAP